MQVVVLSSNILRLLVSLLGLLILSFNIGYLNKILILPGTIWKKLTKTFINAMILMVLLGSTLTTSLALNPIPSAPIAQNTSYKKLNLD